MRTDVLKIVLFKTHHLGTASDMWVHPRSEEQKLSTGKGTEQRLGWRGPVSTHTSRESFFTQLRTWKDKCMRLREREPKEGGRDLVSFSDNRHATVENLSLGQSTNFVQIQVSIHKFVIILTSPLITITTFYNEKKIMHKV